MGWGGRSGGGGGDGWVGAGNGRVGAGSMGFQGVCLDHLFQQKLKQPFEFLNLCLLAYLGGGEALSQVQVGESRLLSEAGSTGFLLWRSVYVVKQVSLLLWTHFTVMLLNLLVK